MSRELFGTDGLRGIAGAFPLDAAGGRLIGMAVGTHFAQAGQKIVIACDPRESSKDLVVAITEGLMATGVSVTSIGVITTPGLAYITRENDDFVAGVMVTASHNPYNYNGVKVFDAKGNKLSDDTEVKLNSLITDGTPERGLGGQTDNSQLLQSYEDFLVSSADGLDLGGLSMAVDSANGAGSGIAARVFTRLNATITPMFDEPDGQNINAGCGATNTLALQDEVVTSQLAMGIALDGDADRVMLVDNQGRMLNGDHLLYLLAVSAGLDGVVATVMTNLGAEQSIKKQGIKLERVAVGDRYVLEGLARTGFRLGGEQSGHIIFADLLKTGDGLLAAVQTAKSLSSSGKTLAQWRDEVTLLPQALINIPLPSKSRLQQPVVQQFIAAQTSKLAGSGRLLIRPSGTEPLARVMVEAPDANTVAQEIADQLTALVADA